jgi:transketolase
MATITLIPVTEFQRVRQAPLDGVARLELIADMCRANTLAAVKLAGSGHLGSSFSAMDIVVFLYYEEMNTLAVGYDSPDRDIYFSSKGHDVPGLYSVLYSLGVIPRERFIRLRRLGGLDGHPDVGVPGIEANSGSLGMGLSKARGMAWAKRYLGRTGRVFVMTGDGELQEGQNYEALHAAVQQRVTDVTMIVDHNKVQSDKLVSEIINFGDLEAKFHCFGWHVARCDGHDMRQIGRVLAEFRQVGDRPKALIADTIKGRGVSFMEHPVALREGKGFYRWHAGAPDDDSFRAAYRELTDRLNRRFDEFGLAPLMVEEVDRPEMTAPRSALGEPVSGADTQRSGAKVSSEHVVEAYGRALLDVAARHPELVVLDADLAADCRIRDFELRYPDRFIENGIAEQDMVSMAGGLARLGLLPVVNSFSSFLASRANEQIYNNASESSRIIYVFHYAGLIPAGPGKSHQSVRDISLVGALPTFVILQPCNSEETRQVVDYCVDKATVSCVIRLVIGPSPRAISLPTGYKLTFGRGVPLTDGGDALLFSCGPVMLAEALLASDLLAARGFGLKVVNMPWLNRVSGDWLRQVVSAYRVVFILDDHGPVGGLGDFLLSSLNDLGLVGDLSVRKLAVDGYPACGTPAEVLRYHGLDGASLADLVLGESQRKGAR